MTIDQLQLAPVMERQARALQTAFPNVVYISGRRDLARQAQAMAANYIQDPQGYLVHNYIHAAELQAAVDAQREVTSLDGIAHLFYTVMEGDPSLVRSPHLDGDAVDLLPMEDAHGQSTAEGNEVIDWIQACPDTTDFRMREGRLVRWHWACRHDAATHQL